mgnify:CR=1 FL=1
MRHRTVAVWILLGGSVGSALLATAYLRSNQAGGWAENVFKHTPFYLIIVSFLLFALVESALLATPYLRKTRAGGWAENVLKHTPFYLSAKSVYWSVTRSVTPAFLRRWVGRSRACSFRDVLNYSRNHEHHTREVADVKATARLLQRDPAGYELWSTSDYSWWIPGGESWGLFEVLAEQKRDIYGKGEIAVRPGDVVVDCGANVGSYARHALGLGAKLVVAIEPAPDDVECLRRNLASEIATGRVIVYPKGVWDHDDCLFFSGSGAGRRVSEDQSDRSRGLLRVPVTTIDKLVRELHLERVDFVKMDIEGAEVAAVLGAQYTLSKFKPRLAIAGYHNREDSEAIPRVVSKAWPS